MLLSDRRNYTDIPMAAALRKPVHYLVIAIGGDRPDKVVAIGRERFGELLHLLTPSIKKVKDKKYLDYLSEITATGHKNVEHRIT